jgi:hypothetical protein
VQREGDRLHAEADAFADTLTNGAQRRMAYIEGTEDGYRELWKQYHDVIDRAYGAGA